VFVGTCISFFKQAFGSLVTNFGKFVATVNVSLMAQENEKLSIINLYKIFFATIQGCALSSFQKGYQKHTIYLLST
jgi:hypothetical protein